MLYSIPPQPTFRRVTAILCAILFLLICGHATYTRNKAWATEKSLWSDAIRKAPNSSRAAHNLGMINLKYGQYQQAYNYFNWSLKNAGNSPTPKDNKAVSLNGIGNVSYVLGRYEQALIFFDRCLDIDQKSEACLKNKVLSFLKLGYPKKALLVAHKLTAEYPVSPAYQYLAALSAYRTGDIDTSLQKMQKIVKQSLNNHEGMYLIGILLGKKKVYESSILFLQRVTRLSPNTIKYQLALAGVYYAYGKNSMAKKIIENVFNKYSLLKITNAIESIKKYNEIDQVYLKKVQEALAVHSEGINFL
jgi:tetratricopeptide (TPR) repeat protein